MTKRAFDLVVATAALVVLSPLLLLVAVSTLAANGRPVLFRQERVGRHGRTFRIHKFRTMRASPGCHVTADSDPRITRLGRLLRATKLDELPQLFDVLLGRMSLVGPRPEVPQFVAYWPASVRARILRLRPGVTDPASVTYRHESAELARAADAEDYYITVVLPRKVAIYEEYARTRTFWRDLLILARTCAAVLGLLRRVEAAPGQPRPVPPSDNHTVSNRTESHR